MKNVLTILLFFLACVAYSQKPDSTIYELRIYKAAEGKRDQLTNMIQNSAEKMFEKHGMGVIGFWTDADSSRVIFIIAHKNKMGMENSWKDFYSDPAWPSLKANLSNEGPVTVSIKSIPMEGADILPKMETINPSTPHRDELRIYTCYPDRLPNLINRFRAKTNSLFAKHQMYGIAYWKTIEVNGKQPQLIYILRHKDKEGQVANWKEFRADPEWIAFKDETEKDGKIVDKVDVVNMMPVK